MGGTCQARIVRNVPELAEELSAWPTDPVEVVRLIYPRLLAAARRIASSRQEAEDLVQEAFVETLSRHPELAGISHPLGYLRTVLYRAAFARRRRLRWKEVPLDLQDRLAATEPQVIERLVVEAGMASLGRGQRTCLILRFVHGLDNEEIAAALGCSRSTVRSQIARGIARLRERIGDEDSG